MKITKRLLEQCGINESDITKQIKKSRKINENKIVKGYESHGTLTVECDDNTLYDIDMNKYRFLGEKNIDKNTAKEAINSGEYDMDIYNMTPIEAEVDIYEIIENGQLGDVVQSYTFTTQELQKMELN